MSDAAGIIDIMDIDGGGPLLRGRASACALAGNIKRQRRGVRDVEALDPAGEIEPRHSVARGAGQLPQSLALRAENQRERGAQRRVAEVDVSRAVEADQE